MDALVTPSVDLRRRRRKMASQAMSQVVQTKFLGASKVRNHIIEIVSRLIGERLIDFAIASHTAYRAFRITNRRVRVRTSFPL